MADIKFWAIIDPETELYRPGRSTARLDVGLCFLCRFSIHCNRYVAAKRLWFSVDTIGLGLHSDDWELDIITPTAPFPRKENLFIFYQNNEGCGNIATAVKDCLARCNWYAGLGGDVRWLRLATAYIRLLLRSMQGQRREIINHR